MANKLELPTLARHLVHFEVAARLGNFSAASRELNQSQPAISHSVKVLEERLKVSLFERLHRGVKLTDAGVQLLNVIQESQEAIKTTYAHIQNQNRDVTQVSLSVSTALATYRILPAIADFRKQNPDIHLRFITHDTDASLTQEEADLVIPLGIVSEKNWPQYQRWRLVDEIIFPVCSPEYLKTLEQTPDRLKLEDLKTMTLIHLEERYESRMTWQKWFEQFEIKTSGLSRGNSFNDYSVLVQTALEGQGVILGWQHIVKPLLQESRLIRLGQESMTTDNPFYVLAVKKRPLSEASKKLKNWLLTKAFR